MQDKCHELVVHDRQGEEYQQPITSSYDLVRLAHPKPVLNRTKSRSKCQSLGLTLLNARSSLELKIRGSGPGDDAIITVHIPTQQIFLGLMKSKNQNRLTSKQLILL